MYTKTKIVDVILYAKIESAKICTIYAFFINIR